MREKIVAQPELDFDPPMLKITQDFHSKYERISEILDQTPFILNQAHADLEVVAEEESSGRSRYAWAKRARWRSAYASRWPKKASRWFRT